MKKYRYIGAYEVTYPDIVIPGEGSLVAHPGDEREFDSPPDPHWWVEVADPNSKPKQTKAKD